MYPGILKIYLNIPKIYTLACLNSVPDINSQNEKIETAIVSVDKACMQKYPSLPDELVDWLILV